MLLGEHLTEAIILTRKEREGNVDDAEGIKTVCYLRRVNALNVGRVDASLEVSGTSNHELEQRTAKAT